MLAISQAFDAGNIEVINADDPSRVQLNIRPDTHSEYFQWFYFRVSGTKEQPLGLHFLNAKDAAFKDWSGYQALASYDQEFWFRVPTRYDNGVLVIEHTPEQNSIYYAYFAPYSLDRHQQLVAQAQTHPACEVEVLGQTVQGRDIDCLVIGDQVNAKHKVWITARQHPGESMAEWCAEGLISRLLDDDDAISAELLKDTVFYIVPHVNPDGSFLGHLRTNALGVNLNRVWNLPDDEAHEVAHVRRKMQEIGCSLFLDLHGDEEIPYNFIAGQEGLPVKPEVLQAEAQFLDDLIDVNPDFQKEYGYEPDRFGEQVYSLAGAWVGREFGIPAMTLEMPFKDCKTRPDELQGWSAERSLKMGESLLHPIKRYLRR